MITWFLERQVRILAILSLACLLLTLAVGDERWPVVIGVGIVSLIFVGLGQRLFIADTAENWLSLNYGDLIKNVVSGVLSMIGWIFFLRGGLALAIGAAILKMG